ncbi:hypothetical protein D9M71_396930 [compost metagenome]
MGAVLPALQADALAFVECAKLSQRRLVAAVLQAVAKHEKGSAKPLPAQELGQAVGAAARQRRAAVEGQQEQPVIEFVTITFKVGKAFDLAGSLGEQRGLA